MAVCKLQAYKEGHQKFIDALPLLHIFSIITSFLLDPETNTKDADDIEFLRALLFHNEIRNHIMYANDTIFKAKLKTDISHLFIKALAILSNFYDTISHLYQQDVLESLQNTDDIELIEKYFSHLNPNMKLHLISYYMRFCPQLFSLSKKLKTYLVFS